MPLLVHIILSLLQRPLTLTFHIKLVKNFRLLSTKIIRVLPFLSLYFRIRLLRLTKRLYINFRKSKTQTTTAIKCNQIWVKHQHSRFSVSQLSIYIQPPPFMQEHTLFKLHLLIIILCPFSFSIVLISLLNLMQLFLAQIRANQVLKIVPY